MKQLFIIGAMLLVVATSAQEKKFTLTGTVPVSTKKYTALLSWNNGAAAEEAKVLNGRFVINGTITEPVVATLSLQEVNPPAGKEFDYDEYQANNLQLFLDEGTVTVVANGKLKDAKVSGSAITNDFASYQQQVKLLKQLENELGKTYYEYGKKKNAAVSNGLMKMYDQLGNVFLAEQEKYIRNNPSSPVSLFFVQEALGFDMDAAKAEPLFRLLSPALQNSAKGKEIQEQIAIGNKSKVGTEAENFTQPDANGNPVPLQSLRGKYVLVDFWASWCGPCRAESPNLVKAYQQYKSRNFEILSITLDQSRDKWLKAVTEDGYTWPQVGDLKGWENQAARQFGVMGIPFNFLLDPNGVIIARNLRGDALEQKLKEILK